MNKYIILGIVLVLIIAGGAVYRANFLPEASRPIVTGVERDITIVVHKDTWTFEPEYIEADQGDKLNITVVNRDDYDHGFSIDAFGISQRLPALGTIFVEFVATKAGDFPYYCSVSCGAGIVNGESRGHFDQIGRLHVKSLVSDDSGAGAPIVGGEDIIKQARQAATIAPATEKAKEFGYNTSSLEIVFDEGNSLWKVYEQANVSEVDSRFLPTDEGFQIILYRDASGNPVLWVFIDDDKGDVIGAFEVK
jgi:plastocyanin